MPFQIESLRLTKVGPLANFEAHFHKNAINIIYGSCGSGKSTIIRSILYAFGIKHRYFTERVFGEGEIRLSLFLNQDSISITAMESLQSSTRGYQCLIADDPFEKISKKILASLLIELKRLKIQIIATASLLIDPSELSNKTNVIEL